MSDFTALAFEPIIKFVGKIIYPFMIAYEYARELTGRENRFKTMQQKKEQTNIITPEQQEHINKVAAALKQRKKQKSKNNDGPGLFNLFDNAENEDLEVKLPEIENTTNNAILYSATGNAGKPLYKKNNDLESIFPDETSSNRQRITNKP